MAQKSNYALISALYANETKGLYSDIYFPIIKYSIAKIFSKKNLEVSYCTADEINEFIKDKFGIDIPIIVISKSVLKISKISNEKLICKFTKMVILFRFITHTLMIFVLMKRKFCLIQN